MNCISLRPISYDDTNLIVRWRNNPAVRRNLLSQDLITCESHLDYYKKQILTKLNVQFIILCEESITNSITPIGTVLLKNIDAKNHNCELGIFIGEQEYRGKGYGKQALRLLLEYGFTQLHMHKIYLKVLSDNLTAIQLYQKIGFSEEADLRDDYFRAGFYFNVIQMSMLEKEYYEKYM